MKLYCMEKNSTGHDINIRLTKQGMKIYQTDLHLNNSILIGNKTLHQHKNKTSWSLFLQII